MPAPAMSSRHLYTGHRRGHIQAAPRLRAHRGGPLSRDHPQIPVSMPSLFRFDASAVVHTCSSSHRTPAPLTARRHPQRSPPRLLTDAACGGLESPPARRPRRTYPHHWHSTDRADDLLHHHHHFPSGHTWVPETRPWSLTSGDAGRCWTLVYHITYRFLASLARLPCGQAAQRTLRSPCCATNSVCSADWCALCFARSACLISDGCGVTDLVLDGREPAERRVPRLPVVEDLKVHEDGVGQPQPACLGHERSPGSPNSPSSIRRSSRNPPRTI